VNIRTTPESQNSLRRTSNANRSQIDQHLPVWAALIIAMAFGVLGLLTTGGAVLFVFCDWSASRGCRGRNLLRSIHRWIHNHSQYRKGGPVYCSPISWANRPPKVTGFAFA
jgi:hypothetical protein